MGTQAKAETSDPKIPAAMQAGCRIITGGSVITAITCLSHRQSQAYTQEIINGAGKNKKVNPNIKMSAPNLLESRCFPTNLKPYYYFQISLNAWVFCHPRRKPLVISHGLGGIHPHWKHFNYGRLQLHLTSLAAKKPQESSSSAVWLCSWVMLCVSRLARSGLFVQSLLDVWVCLLVHWPKWAPFSLVSRPCVTW